MLACMYTYYYVHTALLLLCIPAGRINLISVITVSSHCLHSLQTRRHTQAHTQSHLLYCTLLYQLIISRQASVSAVDVV